MVRQSLADHAAPWAAWVGPTTGAELGWVRRAIGGLVDVVEFPDAAASVANVGDDAWPALVLLGSDVAARWPLSDLTALARRWPLAPLVSVAASLVDGRRRSGPGLPATEEVPWSEAPARLAWWLADRAAGRPGTLGLPTTARREDRALQAAVALRPDGPSRGSVSVAADRPADLDGLAALLAASGRDPLRCTCGRPPLDEPADVLVWDTGTLGPAHLSWLRMLAANRPGLGIVVVDSFPRPETALVALRHGAAAVLGRPLAPESLAGAMLRLESGPVIHLGPSGEPG